MLSVLLVLWGSVLVGRFLRKWPQMWVGRLLTASIWLMLFTIGIEVGGNETLMMSLGRLGWESFVATAFASLGSCFGAMLFWNRSCRRSSKILWICKYSNNTSNR